jgi:hypothetical protein
MVTMTVNLAQRERHELFVLVALHALLQRPNTHPNDAARMACDVAKMLAEELKK